MVGEVANAAKVKAYSPPFYRFSGPLPRLPASHSIAGASARRAVRCGPLLGRKNRRVPSLTVAPPSPAPARMNAGAGLPRLASLTLTAPIMTPILPSTRELMRALEAAQDESGDVCPPILEVVSNFIGTDDEWNRAIEQARSLNLVRLSSMRITFTKEGEEAHAPQ